jgi:dihydroneopterin aldolase
LGLICKEIKKLGMTGTLSFNNIKMYGYHGIHAEEKSIGTYFLISIDAKLKADFKRELPNLRNSINYEELFRILKNVFSKREELIEQVAFNIYHTLKDDFKQVEKWKIRIEKQNPLGQEGFNPAFELSEF